MKLTHHGPQDYQSLLMHKEAVRMIQADPALIEKALVTLTRWDAIVDRCSKPLRDQWVEILTSQNWTLALEESDLGNQLRQASPMATLLPNSVRLAIIAEVKALKNGGGGNRHSVRVACNSRGYPLGWLKTEFEYEDYKPGFLVDLEGPEKDMP